MMGRKHQLLIDTIQRLLRREAYTNIKRILVKTHPADVAVLLTHFDDDRRRFLFDQLEDVDSRSEAVAEMNHQLAAEFLGEMDVGEVVRLLLNMESDDAADIIGSLPDELSKEVLSRFDKTDSDEVGDLLRYREDTAGGIMNPDFIALLETTTAQEAIEVIRQNREVDMAFYLYVVNEHEQLVGVLSLRKLVLVSPDTILKDIMEPNVVSVRTETDQEEVSRLVARYDLLAIPVTDGNNILVGIVTVDDVIDVIKEEATEDMLKMAGAGDVLVNTDSVSGSAKARFPWLLVGFLGELVGVALITPFLGQLQTHHLLALFMPIIMAMGGNVGTQSATIIVRGLATGHVNREMVFPLFWREFRVALVLGLTYGTLIGGVSFYLSDYSIHYALAVSISMTLAMLIAVTVGTLLPIILERLRIDPAVSTGPFVTSAVDVLGLLTYFLVSGALLNTL